MTGRVFSEAHEFLHNPHFRNQKKLRTYQLELPEQSRDFFPSKNAATPSLNWSYHIRNCVSQGNFKEALWIYARNRGTRSIILGAVPIVLKACASLSMVIPGKALHAECVKSGVEFDVMVGTALVDLYGKCGDVVSSRQVFDDMPKRNVITWNAMIGGYMKNGDTNSALLVFESMPERTSVTWNEMIDGYGRNGDLVMAKQLFDKVPDELRNVVTWTVMVDGYASCGEMDAAREVFEGMPRRNFYVWSSMVSGYFKKGDIKNAKAIFERMTSKNLVNWNSLISGYTQNGLCEEALEAFRTMQDEGFEPDEVTMASALSACAQLSLLDVGKEIHEMIVQKGVKANQFVLNGLVDMYAKCGDLSNARLIFEGMPHKNDATWNSMISGFAIHGQPEEAIELFRRMENSGVTPNEITFLSVLSACAHCGCVEEGMEIFYKMEKYGLMANIKHYGCLVDLLGRAGRLQEALDLIKGMPISPNATVFGSLLGACRIHGNMDMAECVLEEVEKLNSNNSRSCDDLHYVLLSNIYAASERWEKAQQTRLSLSNKGSQKMPGCSLVMLEGPY
ncbi:pentatricopeptide repeat-containing protein At3g21470 [Ipomoea triloba]|uniref:pentatricopeptide repeat-containing protein At3g21470 n=1 Tax=Ipomoea triloba TaxID=35885 RepID=UPI00125D6403|nr:pentatricopeptide repeat-containing protein At3g21470 [Ipomoea triloba]